MTTTTVSPRPPTAAPATTVHSRARAGALGPRRLQMVAVALVVLTVVSGVVALLAMTSRHGATTVARGSAEPLMIDAQTIDTSLSDADSTAAGTFLVGQLEPADLRQRYADDLDRASAALTSTTQQVGTDPQVTSALRTISVALPVYAGLIQTAEFNQRQAYYPLAAAYMAEASNLMRGRILPAAQAAYGIERRHLTGDEGDAVSAWLTVLAVILFLVLLVALVLVQRQLSRQFRRTFNVPLVVATGIVGVVGIWFVVAVTVQNVRVERATSQGSTPVSTFTQARILALQMRADDELTLLSRDAVSTYQDDFHTASDRLDDLLDGARAGAPGELRTRIDASLGALAAYRTAHAQIRASDGAGDLIQAIDEASAPGPDRLPAASVRLDGALASDIATAQGTFDQVMGGAGDALLPLIVLVLPLMIVAALLTLVGLQRRIDEYR